MFEALKTVRCFGSRRASFVWQSPRRFFWWNAFAVAFEICRLKDRLPWRGYIRRGSPEPRPSNRTSLGRADAPSSGWDWLCGGEGKWVDARSAPGKGSALRLRSPHVAEFRRSFEQSALSARLLVWRRCMAVLLKGPTEFRDMRLRRRRADPFPGALRASTHLPSPPQSQSRRTGRIGPTRETFSCWARFR